MIEGLVGGGGSRRVAPRMLCARPGSGLLRSPAFVPGTSPKNAGMQFLGTAAEDAVCIPLPSPLPRALAVGPVDATRPTPTAQRRHKLRHAYDVLTGGRCLRLSGANTAWKAGGPLLWAHWGRARDRHRPVPRPQHACAPRAGGRAVAKGAQAPLPQRGAARRPLQPRAGVGLWGAGVCWVGGPQPRGDARPSRKR
jgi:hypothetical protein